MKRLAIAVSTARIATLLEKTGVFGGILDSLPKLDVEGSNPFARFEFTIFVARNPVEKAPNSGCAQAQSAARRHAARPVGIGVALRFDRLVMIATGTEVMPSPVERA